MEELDPDEVLFVDEYFKNGFKAGKAYLKFHPDVTKKSSYEIGSRWLSKVKNSQYFQSLLDESLMGRDEYLKILASMARQKKAVALNLLGRMYIPTKVEGNLSHTVTWAEFVSSDTQSSNE